METIVLAEDHQLMAEGYRLLIEGIDNLSIVATSTNGEEAIAAIKTHKPNYLMLDLHMPKLNGLEVLRYIADYYPKTKVIVVSMFGDEAMHREVVKLGAKGYVLKNADKDEFLFALQSVMKGKSYYSAEIFEERELPESEMDGPSPIPLVSLTAREEEVLTLIARGYSNKDIAKTLIVSHRTIENHRANLMKKVNVHNVTGLVIYALTNGYKVYR